MKKFLLILSLVMLVATPAFATHWVLIGDGNYIDTDSVQAVHNITKNSQGGHIVFMVKQIANEKPLKVISDQEIWAQRAKVMADCDKIAIKILTFHAYDGSDKPVLEEKVKYPKWEKAPENTYDYEAINYVCNGAYFEHARN